MPIENAVRVLNGLVQTSADGRKGFAEASDEAAKPELKSFFQRRSDDCAAAATELQSLVQSLGGRVETSTAVSGAADPGWDKIKTTIDDANVTALGEMEHAEDKAEAAYAKALTAVLPQQIRNVVERQHNGAVRNHDHIHDLRISYQEAPPT